MGALSNYHPFLYNVKPKEAGYDDSMGQTLRRNSADSPQLGAFSYYRGQVFVAIKDIAAGTEIFAGNKILTMAARTKIHCFFYFILLILPLVL